MPIALKVLLAAGALAYLVALWAAVIVLVKRSATLDVGGWFWAGPATLAAGALIVLAALGVGEARAVLHDDWQAVCGILGVILVPLLGYRGWRAKQDAVVQVAQSGQDAAVQVAQAKASGPGGGA